MPDLGTAQNQRGGSRRREIAGISRVFLVLTAACFIFLWKPITSGQWYAAGDVSGLSSVVRDTGAEPGRLPQIDVTVDFLPWTKFNKEQVRSGRLPLWNPYNNSGAPHLANIQSAVFSPFMMPFYVLSMRVAFIVSAYLILITSGMLMYGLMRHLRASDLAGIVAAVTYMFSGYMVLWLRWPLAAVAAFVPGVLWASSALVRADGWRRVVRRGCALAFLVGLMIFAGHPETMFFGIVPSAVFCIGWLLVHNRGPVDALRRLSRLAVAGIGGLAFGAIQLLPFVEYLMRSSVVQEGNPHVYQSVRWASSHVFPLALGSPVMDYTGPYNMVFEFHEITMFYMGVLSLFLAGVAVVMARHLGSRLPFVFGAIALAVLVFIYDLGGIARFLAEVPLLSLIVPSRVAIIWVLCIGVLAGFGVDGLRALRHVDRSVVRRRAVLVLGPLVAGVAFFAYRSWHQHHHALFRSASERAKAWSTQASHLLFVLVTLAIGLVCAAVFSRTRRINLQRIAAAGLAGIVFLQAGFLLRGQNVSVPEKRFMQFDERVRTIVDEVGVNQTLWVDDATLVPDVNVWLPAYSPDSYDAVGIDTYGRLYRAALGAPESHEIGGRNLVLLRGPYDPPGISGLHLLGVGRVVTGRSYPFVRLVYWGFPDAAATGKGVTYRIDWIFGPPAELVLNTRGIPDGTDLEVRLEGDGIPKGTRVPMTVEGSIGLAHLPEGLPLGGTLTMTAEVGSDEPEPVTADRIAGARLLATEVPGLELERSVDGFQVFRVPGVSGIASAPATASVAPDNSTARQRVLDPDFDPQEEVVLEAGSGVTGNQNGRAGAVATEQNRPDEFTLTVTRSEPGYAVLAQNQMPGWQATVDGVDVSIIRANSTFMAVPVPEGTSQVIFSYRPGSVRWGAVLSLSALGVGLLLVGAGTVRGRRGDEQRADRVGSSSKQLMTR